MTRIQKALGVVLSLCFFAVLAVLPGTFFTGENVYRHLPLYRFLEKKSREMSGYEDRETYEMLARENGKYLGKQAQAEQTPVPDTVENPETEENLETEENPKITEKPKLSEEPVGTEAPKEAETSDERSIHDSSRETVAAAMPHPVIDLSPEKLADPDYMLGQFYIVDDNTEAGAAHLNAPDFLEEDFSIQKDTRTPQILIYHSHSQETFADSREGEEEDSIVGVGNYLAQILTEDYGYQVAHVKEEFDMAGGELDRSAAYDYARDYLESYFQENPDIQVVIDLHRDGVSEDRHLVTEINGKPTAQILFYNGLSYTVDKGNLDYLPNPYIQQNLAFSFQLEYQAAEYYPDYYRGIYLAGYRYNLHFRPRSILLEAGAQTNTVQEVKNAMEPFADILDKVLNPRK